MRDTRLIIFLFLLVFRYANDEFFCMPSQVFALNLPASSNSTGQREKKESFYLAICLNLNDRLREYEWARYFYLYIRLDFNEYLRIQIFI